MSNPVTERYFKAKAKHNSDADNIEHRKPNFRGLKNNEQDCSLVWTVSKDHPCFDYSHLHIPVYKFFDLVYSESLYSDVDFPDNPFLHFESAEIESVDDNGCVLSFSGFPISFKVQSTIWHYFSTKERKNEENTIKSSNISKCNFDDYVDEEQFEKFYSTVLKIAESPNSYITGIIGEPNVEEGLGYAVYPISIAHGDDSFIVDGIKVNIDEDNILDSLDNIVDVAGHPDDIQGTEVAVVYDSSEGFASLSGQLGVTSIGEAESNTLSERFGSILREVKRNFK